MSLAQPALADWSPITMMPGTQAQWVAPDMRLNGVRMRIRALSGNTSPQNVLDYYEHRWAGEHPPQAGAEGAWQTLSTERNQNFVTLRVRATMFGFEGFMVQSQPNRSITKAQSSLPIPSSAKLLYHQSYNDTGKRGETMTLTSVHQPSTIITQFDNELSNAGWTRLNLDKAQTVTQAFTASYKNKTGLVKLFIHGDQHHYQGHTLILLQRLGSK